MSITGDESCGLAVRGQSTWCMKATHHGEVIEGSMGITKLPKADAPGILDGRKDITQKI